MKKKNEAQPVLKNTDETQFNELLLNDFQDEQLKKEQPEPWQRQPDEPAKYYLMFRIFLDLSMKRTYPKVEKMTGISTRTLKRISAKYNWQRRADAHDIANYEKHYKEISEMVSYYNQEKIRQRIQISATIQGLVDGLKSYLINFDNFYESPEAVKKLKYFKNVSKMLMDMIKMTDFSIGKAMNENMVNEVEIAEILKGRQDPDFWLRTLPEDLKGKYKNSLERLARQDKLVKDEQDKIEFEKHKGKTLQEELSDLLDELNAANDSFDDIFTDDDDYEEDFEEDFEDEDDRDDEDDITEQENVDFDNMTEKEIEKYLSFNSDNSLKRVPDNDPTKFNYEKFHAKLVEMEQHRAAYENWKKKKSAKGKGN